MVCQHIGSRFQSIPQNKPKPASPRLLQSILSLRLFDYFPKRLIGIYTFTFTCFSPLSSGMDPEKTTASATWLSLNR